MKHLTVLAAVLCTALTTPCTSQCSQLSTSGPGHQGTMMTFSLAHGHAHAPAIMVFGMQPGNTTFDFGMMGSLHLGLGGPLYPMPMGDTDANGQVHLRLQVPHGWMHRFPMYGQGFTFMFHHGNHHHHGHFEFCTSNVCGFHVGGHHHGS